MRASLDDYKAVAGPQAIELLLQLAKPLAKLKIVHINSTKAGGGVAEILANMVPLTQSLGIENCHWEVIEGTPEFFSCTKGFHNAIQGDRSMPAAVFLHAFEQVNQANAARLMPLLTEADIVFIHDPQPLALIEHFPKRKGKWIWRCHIDAGHPFPPVWSYLKRYIEQYDAAIFSLAEFCHPLSIPMFVILPSIDPLSEKNRLLTEQQVRLEIEALGIDPLQPILLQVSRFDRFKDPLGVIEAYRLVKKFNPAMQLVLAGGGAADDPEGEMVLAAVKLSCESDPTIHVLLLPADAHTTINALQRHARIIIQKSINEGFGLTVTEGLWKGKPVIGGNVGGIRKQIIDGYSGYLVNTPEGLALRISYLLQDAAKMHQMGAFGKKYVQEHFLITRHLQEYLTLMCALHANQLGRLDLSQKTF